MKMIPSLPQTLIIGLGKTGLSCARFLAKQGEPFGVMDDRQTPPELDQFKIDFPDVPIYLGAFDSAILNKVKTLVISPGISLKAKPIAEAIQRGATAIGDIELFVKHAKAPLIAITGSNAKSTVTTLVGHLLASTGLKIKVGGNLGTPALDLLSDTAPNYFVLELSSFQLETTQNLKPLVASILNICPDHMDRYSTLAEYINAKQRIYQNSSIQVLNRQDKNTYPHQASNIISFGTDKPKENQFGLSGAHNNIALYHGKTKLISANELLLKGQHNYLNALAALAICHSVGVSIPRLLPALKTFRGLPHRCEFVSEQKGISWYNDSKGTNVGATVAAIDGLGETIPGKLIWIAGGIGKNADFSPLKNSAKKYVRKAILIGQDAKLIEKALASSVEVVHANSLQKAVDIAHEIANQQDTVLLSPACASFDMFKNFEHRGETFKNLVALLDENHARK